MLELENSKLCCSYSFINTLNIRCDPIGGKGLIFQIFEPPHNSDLREISEFFSCTKNHLLLSYKHVGMSVFYSKVKLGGGDFIYTLYNQNYLFRRFLFFYRNRDELSVTWFFWLLCSQPMITGKFMKGYLQFK